MGVLPSGAAFAQPKAGNMLPRGGVYLKLYSSHIPAHSTSSGKVYRHEFCLQERSCDENVFMWQDTHL